MIIPVGYGNWITEYHISGDSEAMITTMGVDVSTWGGDYAAGVEWLADQWFVCWEGSASTDTIIGPSSIAIGQDGGDPLTYYDTDNDNGNATDYPIWPNSALLVKKTTASGGRRNRGRNYIPGLALRDLVSQAGVVDSALLTDINTNLATFLSTVNAGTGFHATDLVVLHSEAPATPAVITSLVADQKLATQRRRLRP